MAITDESRSYARSRLWASLASGDVRMHLLLRYFLRPTMPPADYLAIAQSPAHTWYISLIIRTSLGLLDGGITSGVMILVPLWRTAAARCCVSEETFYQRAFER